METLWRELDDAEASDRIREDYAIMTFNLAQMHRQEGELVEALAYLLQCEQLDGDMAGRAAMQAARLLSNNPDAALERALAAEERLDTLGPDEQKQLLKFIVELHRRLGDRDRARQYLSRLSAL